MACEWLAFELTDRCQLACQHCLRDPQLKPKDLSLDVIRRVLHDARRLFRSNHVALTGGEPTLHPHFIDVVDAAIDEGLTWHMVTNGATFPRTLPLLQARPLRIQQLTAVSLSLDGADEATHDAIRAPGSFRAVMTAASLCSALKLPFVFNVTLHAKNMHQLEATGLLAAELGAQKVSYVMHCATGAPSDPSLFLSSREWRSVMDRIDRIATVLKLPVSVPEGYYRESLMHTCVAFSGNQIHVDVEGRVNLCCQHAGVPVDGDRRDIAGDLRNISLPEAVERVLGMGHRFQVEKLRALARGDIGSEWDHFPCNYCMKVLGKPYWSDEGSSGPPALRERKKSLPIVG